MDWIFKVFFLSVWPRLRERAEDFAGGDGRQSLAVGLFTGWLVFSRGWRESPFWRQKTRNTWLPAPQSTPYYTLWCSYYELHNSTVHMMAMVKPSFLQDEPPLLKKWLHFLEKHPQVIFLYTQWMFCELSMNQLSISHQATFNIPVNSNDNKTNLSDQILLWIETLENV